MMAVVGGLPLMLLFIGVLISAFTALGRTLREISEGPQGSQFLVWTIGAILFGHALTFFSVNYFDQIIVLYYLMLAAAGSLKAQSALRAESSFTDATVVSSEYFASMVHEGSLTKLELLSGQGRRNRPDAPQRIGQEPNLQISRLGSPANPYRLLR
jgi:hypothetical protein